MNKIFIGAAIFMLSQYSWAQEATYHNWEIRGAALPGMQSYSLTGTGLNTNNGFNSGDGVGGGISWFHQNLAIHADFYTLNTKMTPPPGMTPTSIATKQDRAALTFEVMPHEEGSEKSFNDATPDGISYMLGFEYRGRVADGTSPDAFMPSNLVVGTRFGVGYAMALDENFAFVTKAGLFIPLWFDETTKTLDQVSRRTGYYRISANPDLGLDLVYKVNNFINFALGVHATYEQYYFADTGTRKVANATETTTNVYAPVELRFQF